MMLRTCFAFPCLPCPLSRRRQRKDSLVKTTRVANTRPSLFSGSVLVPETLFECLGVAGTARLAAASAVLRRELGSGDGSVKERLRRRVPNVGRVFRDVRLEWQEYAAAACVLERATFHRFRWDAGGHRCSGEHGWGTERGDTAVQQGHDAFWELSVTELDGVCSAGVSPRLDSGNWISDFPGACSVDVGKDGTIFWLRQTYRRSPKTLCFIFASLERTWRLGLVVDRCEWLGFSKPMPWPDTGLYPAVSVNIGATLVITGD